MPNQNSVPINQEEQENKQVRKDLIRVIILNAFFFAGLIALYIWNVNSGGVDTFFAKLLKF